MIAEVVVDVPAAGTDRYFDYQVPTEFENIVTPGIRVIVPFGNRKLQGFVLNIKSESSFEQLKHIEDVMDVYPVLTEELIELGQWLSKTTICFSITALQSMLPAALRVSYVKEIVISETAGLRELSKELQKLYQSKSFILWDEVKKLPPAIIRQIQKALKSNLLEYKYEVKSKGKQKKVKCVELTLNQDETSKYIDSLHPNAIRQKDVLGFLLNNPSVISTSELMLKSGASNHTIQTLINKKILKESYVERYRDPFEHISFEQSTPLSLTDEQKEAISPILDGIENNKHETILLRGVTGSGKTEIYLQSIQSVLNKGKQAIMLVPEISLTPQMVRRFKERFGKDVAVMHSALSQGEKYDEWRKIYRKQANVVVGARSAIFAPLDNIGLIIIDEEHESSYKQEENPRYHARDVAIWRGKKHQCPVVLGSATPSLESNARADKGIFQLAKLEKRVNDQKLPQVEIIDMREELRAGNRSLFSRSLFEALQEKLLKNEQSVLFLNRRGYSTFVICRDCGYVEECPHCDISLTYHKRNGLLKCHYCGFEKNSPSVCPSCNSGYIRFFGTGTQKVEEELQKLLPDARIIRMDVDTTRRKGMHEKLLSQFGSGNADILLGTQMIAKGLDFPKVTLVGVLAADSMLHIPDFRSAEKTFQLLTQVSGRAGRGDLKGEVIIQTYTPDHYSIKLASKHDFLSFYNHEMKIRRAYQYPPYYFLALVTISHKELIQVIKVSEKIIKHLKNNVSPDSIIYGPVASPIPRIKDKYRYHCMIKYKKEPELTNYLGEILTHFRREITNEGLQITIDPNTYSLM